MQNPIRIATSALMVALLLLCARQHANAQITTMIWFEDLPTGTVLRDQYSNLGVHFVQDDRYQLPHVSTTPLFPSSTGPHVGYAQEHNTTGIFFDSPIAWFSIDVAIDGAGRNGTPFLDISGLDTFPPTQVVIPMPGGPLSAVNTWQNFTFVIPAGVSCRMIELTPHMIYNNLAYDVPLAFDNIEFLYVPEPSTSRILTIVMCLLALTRRFSRKSRVEAPACIARLKLKFFDA